jgi:TonB family protein
VQSFASMSKRYSAGKRCAFLVAALAFAVLPAVAASQPPPPTPPIPSQPPQQAAEVDPSFAIIQFDAMGVDFGPWLRALLPQITRNWKSQTAAIQDKGHVELGLEVHRDGTIIEFRVKKRSTSPSIDQAALKALTLSSPTPPLPPEFPKETCPFQITLYCNEVAPSPIRRP